MNYSVLASGVLFVSALALVVPRVVHAQPTHQDMHLLKQFLDRSETTNVGYLKLGDSRSSWLQWRDVGSFYRQFDVRHAALVLPAAEANNGSEDGLGGFPLSQGGAVWAQVGAGGTLPNAGFVNRFPAALGEMWFTLPPNNPQWNRWYILFSTAGFDMDSQPSGGSGGQFKRGDPAQGRPLSSLEYWLVADDQPNKWIGTRIECGYTSPATAPPFNESGALLEDFPAPSVAQGVGIVRYQTSMMPSPATGLGIRARLVHTDGFAIGKGHVLLGMRLNFGGDAQGPGPGVVYAQVAQGGWSHTDHMPASVSSANDNPDSKYDLPQMTQWLSTVFRTEYLVIDEEIGQNSNPPGNFPEWDGIVLNSFRENKRVVLQRWIDAALQAGYEPSKILVVSRVPWRSSGDTPDRIDAMRSETLALHVQQPFASSGIAGYVVYDQQLELEARGWAQANGAVLPQFRSDPVHQNYTGMNMLGETMWSVIAAAGQPACDEIDVNNDGAFFDITDIDAFLSVYSEGPCIPPSATCSDIDFNNDGASFDPCDIDSFLQVFSEGPCTPCGV